MKEALARVLDCIITVYVRVREVGRDVLWVKGNDLKGQEEVMKE